MLHVSYMYCSPAYQDQPWNRAQSQVGFVIFPSPCISFWHIKVRLGIKYKTRTAPYFSGPCILLWHMKIRLVMKQKPRGAQCVVLLHVVHFGTFRSRLEPSTKQMGVLRSKKPVHGINVVWDRAIHGRNLGLVCNDEFLPSAIEECKNLSGATWRRSRLMSVGDTSCHKMEVAFVGEHNSNVCRELRSQHNLTDVCKNHIGKRTLQAKNT